MRHHPSGAQSPVPASDGGGFGGRRRAARRVRLAEDKVPVVARVEVHAREADDDKGVGGPLLVEQLVAAVRLELRAELVAAQAAAAISSQLRTQQRKADANDAEQSTGPLLDLLKCNLNSVDQRRLEWAESGWRGCKVIVGW